MGTLKVRRLVGHDMTFGHGKRDLATAAEATGQRLRCRLLSIRGEWFLDTDNGVPWWQPLGSPVRPIMGGPRDLQYTEAVLKAVILKTDGVATLDSFTMRFNGETRGLSVTASGTSVDGDVWNIDLAQVGP